MDLLDAIFTRRSIRKFTGEPVDEHALDLILKAGFQAPSAHNKQPLHFVVVKDEKLLRSIAEKHPYAKMLPQAGCGIVVCGDKELEDREGFLVEDCSAAIENMLLAAHASGLGAVWCGIHPVGDLVGIFTDLLQLPANVLPVGLVVIGHSDVTAKTQDRYNGSRIHRETW